MNIAPPVFLPTITPPPPMSAPVVELRFAALIAALPIAAPIVAVATTASVMQPIAGPADEAAQEHPDDGPPVTIPEVQPSTPLPWLFVARAAEPADTVKDKAIAPTTDRAPLTLPELTLPERTLPELALPMTAPRSVDVLMTAAPAPVTDQALNLTRDTLWLDTLAREIVAASVSTDRVSFRLMPERLGPLDISLAHSDAGVAVRMTTHSDEAAAIIAAVQPRLIDDMKAQGLRVAEAQVNSDTPSHQGQSDHQKRTTPLIETAPHESTAPTPKIQPDGRYA